MVGFAAAGGAGVTACADLFLGQGIYSVLDLLLDLDQLIIVPRTHASAYAQQHTAKVLHSEQPIGPHVYRADVGFTITHIWCHILSLCSQRSP